MGDGVTTGFHTNTSLGVSLGVGKHDTVHAQSWQHRLTSVSQCGVALGGVHVGFYDMLAMLPAAGEKESGWRPVLAEFQCFYALEPS